MAGTCTSTIRTTSRKARDAQFTLTTSLLTVDRLYRSTFTRPVFAYHRHFLMLRTAVQQHDSAKAVTRNLFQGGLSFLLFPVSLPSLLVLLFSTPFPLSEWRGGAIGRTSDLRFTAHGFET